MSSWAGQQQQKGGWYCSMCDDEINPIAVIAHIPQCYRRLCAKHQILPFCCCNSCQGNRSHEGDTLDGGTAPVAIIGGVVPAPSPYTPGVPGRKRGSGSGIPGRKRKSRSGEEMDEELASGAMGPIPTSVKSLTGKVCCFCGRIKSPSNCPFPPVRIGRFRALKICMKNHMKQELARTEIEILIEKELEKIRTEGDKPITKIQTLMVGSDDEDEEKREGEETKSASYELEGDNPERLEPLDTSINNNRCAGYTELLSKTKCNEETDGLLRLKDRDRRQTYTFCKATHLTRFLLNDYCQWGRKVYNPRKKEGKRYKSPHATPMPTQTSVPHGDAGASLG